MGGFDFAGGTACCFAPNEIVDVYQGSVSSGNYTGVTVQADASGRVTFQAGNSVTGLQLVSSYPLNNITFIAVGENTGHKQLVSTNVQIVRKVNLSSSTWVSGEQVQISGFSSGTNAQVCLNQSTHTTGCDTQLGTAIVGATGKVAYQITSKPASGSYQVVVNAGGQAFANALTVP